MTNFSVPSEDDMRRIFAEEGKKLLKEMIMKLNVLPKLLTRKQVAELYQVGVDTIIEWEKKGILNPLKIRSRIRFRASELPFLDEDDERRRYE